NVRAAKAALSQPAQTRTWPKNSQAMPRIPAGRKTESDSKPSRDSHELRHCEKARQARSGWPRWNVEATRPIEARPSDKPSAKNPNQRLSGRMAVPDNTPIRNNRPYPAPDKAVKTITERAGCMG